MSLVVQTAHQLQAAIARGDVSPREVVQAFVDRIQRVDGELGAFLTVTPEEALAQADEEAQAERGEGGAQGEVAKGAGGSKAGLLGLPIAIKDNLSTRGVATTCASQMLANYVPPFDATAVARVREAGLPVLGKTNMDEFAMGSSTEHSALKRTRNPWNEERVPGGSSGGSAAAVAAHLVPWALGSDTGGSIRQPAAWCGIVGLKPTYGRVSRFGLVPLAPSLDCIGPMAKDVRDTAMLLNVIAGHDPLDGTSSRREVPDFTAALGRDVKGMKVGLVSEWLGEGVDPEVMAAVREAAETLAGLGAHVEEISLPAVEHAIAVYYVLVAAEGASSLARYDGVRYGHRSADAPDSATMFINSRTEAIGFEAKWRAVLGTWALSDGRRHTLYDKAQRVRALIRRDMAEALDRFDVLLGPTAPTPAYRFGEGDRDPMRLYAADLCTLPASLAGVPALSVPCGLSSEGLPMGLQMIGRPFAEDVVLQAAYAYEQAVGADAWRLGEEVAYGER